MSLSLLIVSLLVTVLSAILLGCAKRNKIRRIYFPSPPSDFFLGHLRTLNRNIPWITLTNLGKDYGDILQLFIMGRSVVVLNKADDADVLLNKRGSNYSDRPRTILQGEIGGIEYFTGFVRYGDDFRTLRRYTIQHYNSHKHVKMYPLLHAQVKILLKNLLKTPNKFEDHLDTMAAATIVKTTYGYDVQSNDDGYSKLAIDAVSAVASLGVNGLTIVDIFPFLQYVPTWIPGASLFRVKRAKETRILIDRMLDEPYEYVKSQRKSGFGGSSMVDILLESNEKAGVLDKKSELLIKNAAGQIYGAGVETSADILHTFIFEMVHHPEVAKKAQAQIDRVIAERHQLPTLNDRADIPYIDCMIKEVLRVNPALPLGVPHASLREDSYKGKTIPAGSIIIPNVWAMAHDEQYFPDPDTFNPDRFESMIKQENKAVHPLNIYRPNDPSALIFGFGRRICPGRYLADANAWLVIANILAVFDILPALDPQTGEEILPDFGWRNIGITAKLKPFEVRIVPRSEDHARLVRQETQG